MTVLSLFGFAEGNSGEKSRRERRKEARLTKSKTKFNSWVHHQVIYFLKIDFFFFVFVFVF